MCNSKVKLSPFQRCAIIEIGLNVGCELNVMSDFYEALSEYVKKETDDGFVYNLHAPRIRARLRTMKKKGLITAKRGGTGMFGKTDFGYTSSNQYFLTNKGKEIYTQLITDTSQPIRKIK